MTDLRKLFRCNLEKDRITVSEEEIIELNSKWNEIDNKEKTERISKNRSWEKIKNKIVNFVFK